ncbi:hypothetical protein GII36_00600 [Candidatus Mycosynbacter amalyticus]|uniref:Uncharacterized protein n=1 Tax=Candidatus Mycosynbacter amalyticus TaxID=2665156 RepID=A0A857MJN7_9BACT|nr:hypothetical protein [Candidatus Mycosynbacter amalyticus]QHN42358.1 hypothetical protein GII36_00600 [Candidatus Mycosynbacter amalyticus]
MDPQQTPPPAAPGGYPLETPPTQPQFGAPSPAPDQFLGAQSAQPQTQYTPSAPQYNAPQQPYQPQAAPSPAQWYTPAPDPAADRPADASSYVQAATAAQGQTQQAPGAQGQIINGQYSVDYLNQMATPSKQPLDKKFIIAGIGIVIALLLAAVLFLAGGKKTTSVASEVKLYTTLVDTEASTLRSGKLIKNSKLVAINSNLRTSLVNAARDMETPLTNMGQNASNLKSAAKKAPYHDDKLVTNLEDARLNSTYDRVYANEMDTKTKYIITYMESIKKRNSRKSMQEFIAKNEPNFQTIQKSIEEYQNSDEANLY